MNGTYQLIMTDEPGNHQANETQRLKAFLKAMKRGYGFRCVSIFPVKYCAEIKEYVEQPNALDLLKEIE